MNKQLAGLIDSYALFKFHLNRSKGPLFNNSIEGPIDINLVNEFSSLDETPIVNFNLIKEQEKYEIGEFSYKSQCKTEFETNNIVRGNYYKNKGKEEISVVFVHGWRSEGHEYLENIYLREFMKKEYNMYFYTLPYHMERTPSCSAYSGEYMLSANIDMTLMAFKQAVIDLRGLIAWIKENKRGRVILIGVSLGGLVCNLTSVVEKNIDALISIMYANSLSFSIWNTPPGKHIKKELIHNNFSYEELENYWNILNPSNFKPAIPKENILLLSGAYDKYVFLEDTDKLWNAWDMPKRIVYPCGHAGVVLNRKRIYIDTIDFIDIL